MTEVPPPDDDPLFADDSDDDEDRELTDVEKREILADDLATAHGMLVAFVEFPRPDNDLDELDGATARLILSDELDMTEMVAADALLDNALEDMHEKINGDGGGPQGMAIPAPDGLLEALAQDLADGGGDSNSAASGTGKIGFQ